MNRRSVLLLLATLVAVIGTALVFVYVRNADNRAIEKFDTVDVLTAVGAIEAGESIESAQSSGKLKMTAVPEAAKVPGALDTTDALEGQVAVTTIYPGEQIIAGKFGGEVVEAPLAIPKGMQAISVELTDPGRVAGFVSPGSEVAIFHVQAEGEFEDTHRVVLLLKRVLVLGVGSTSTVTKTTTTAADGAQTTQEVPKTLLTIAVSQEDAEKVIWAYTHGKLTFSLLTDESKTDYTRGTARDSLYNS
jgi:pilus assembly protein CpaB